MSSWNVLWLDFNYNLCMAVASQPVNIGPQDIPRTSRGRPPPKSPGRPLKILFDRPGDVSVWRLGHVAIWRPGDVLKWRPWDVLIWRSRDVPGRLIRDVPRTFSGRPLEDLQSSQTWMSKILFKLFFQNLFDWFLVSSISNKRFSCFS